MPPKPAGTLLLLFAPTCFLSGASPHPDLIQSPISVPCCPTISLSIHSLHNSQLQCLQNGSFITPVLKNLAVVFQAFRTKSRIWKIPEWSDFFPITSQISSLPPLPWLPSLLVLFSPSGVEMSFCLPFSSSSSYSHQKRRFLKTFLYLSNCSMFSSYLAIFPI